MEKETEKGELPPGVPVQVMIDGPYGGSSVDLGDYESVLLVAGGAGATFTLAMLDDIVARCVKLGRRNGEKTRRIEFVWCIRSYGTFYSVHSSSSFGGSSTRLSLQVASSGSRRCSWTSRIL